MSGAGRTIDWMASPSELVAVDLSERERGFIDAVLREWGGSAGSAPMPIEVLGLSTWDEFDALTDRLRGAITRGEPLTNLDWARALFLTEVGWASDLVGSGLDFSIVRFADEEAVKLLRALQRKISNRQRAQLLFPGRGRPRNVEELERETAKMLQEIGKDWPNTGSNPS